MLGRPVWIAIVATFLVAFGGLISLSDGLWIIPVIVPLVFITLAFGYFREHWAICITVFLCVLQDQLNIQGGYVKAITGPGYLPWFENMKNIRGLQSLGFLKASMMELFLGYIFFVWFIKRLAVRRFDLKPAYYKGPMLAIGLVVLIWATYGQLRNGDFKVMLWEVRALGYLVVFYFFLGQVLEGRRMVRTMTWIILICVTFKAWQGLFRYFVVLGTTMAFDGKEVETVTNHEDALFFTHLFILYTSMLFLKRAPRSQRIFLGLNLIPLALCFIVTQRRVAYGAIFFGALFTFFLLPRQHRLAMLKPFVALNLVFWLAYYPAFKNSTSSVGMLAQQVNTIVGSEENNASNEFRVAERSNLWYTIRRHPMGVGFGRRYYTPYRLAKIDFDLWDYIPHNAVLWIWVKTGYPGMFIFCMAWATIIAKSALAVFKLRDPYHKAIAITITTAIINQLVVAYYDLQLTYYRNMILLGVWLAVMDVMLRYERGVETEPGRLAT